MKSYESLLNENKRVFILTSSGGAGHLTATEALKQQILEKHQNAKIWVYDVMMGSSWNLVGRIGIFIWNFSQKKGRVKAQEKLVSLQKFAEYMWPQIFFKVLYALIFYKAERIIDTQPVATGAAVKAVRIYNWLFKKKIIFEKVFVDLPTEKNTHFYMGIKKLSEKDKQVLQVYTLPPLTLERQSEKDFWHKHCNLEMDKIDYDHYPIRKSFLKLQKQSFKNKQIHLEIETKSSLEKKLISTCLDRFQMVYENTMDGFSFDISFKTIVITILLGSQAAEKGTLDYTKAIIEYAQKHLEKSFILFVYTGKMKKEKGLLKKMICLLKSIPRFSENIQIVPMTFQKEIVIAKLFKRSDVTITRSGAQTIMELATVSEGLNLIHSETHVQEPVFSDLVQGIPLWEGGNALYFIQKKGGDLVSPPQICEKLDRYLAI